jgi:hypothetical protein
MPNILAEHASNLYDLLDGDHGTVDDNTPLDDHHVEHDWVVLGSSPSRTSRWHEKYWLVLRNAADEVYGIEYGVGLTENQEDDLPWDGSLQYLELTPLHRREVMTVTYDNTPPRTTG